MKHLDVLFTSFLSVTPICLVCLKVRRSKSLIKLAESFNVDVETVLLALGYLKRAGFIKDVKFV